MNIVIENRSKHQNDLFKGSLEIMILSALRDKPMHGYAIRNHILVHSGELLAVEEGSLYPALQRALKAAHVTVKHAVSAKNRDIRLYEITPQGLARLDRQAAQFEQMSQAILAVINSSKTSVRSMRRLRRRIS